MGEIKSVSTRLEVTEEIDDDEARSFFRRFPFPQLEVYVASVKKKIQSLIKSLLNLFLLCHEYLKPHGRIFFRVSRSVHARITVCSWQIEGFIKMVKTLDKDESNDDDQDWSGRYKINL